MVSLVTPGTVTAAAIIVTRATPGDLEELALPGVNGVSESAEAFAALWSRRSGCRTEVKMPSKTRAFLFGMTTARSQ